MMPMTLSKAGWFLAAALVVFVGRLFVPGHGLSLAGSYEAVAHIWVGWMMAEIMYNWKRSDGWLALSLLAVSTVFETVMFLLRKP